MNPQRSETYRLSFMIVLAFCLGWLWQRSMEIEPKRRAILLSRGGTDQSWKLEVTVEWNTWERTAEQRKASRSKRHLTSGVWPKAGLCKTAKLSKSNKNWGYMHNYGWFTLYGRNKHNTGKEKKKLNIGCWGARNSSERQQVTQCQRTLMFQSRQRGENGWWPQALSETP